jgi:hypothetical protein
MTVYLVWDFDFMASSLGAYRLHSVYATEELAVATAVKLNISYNEIAPKAYTTKEEVITHG